MTWTPIPIPPTRDVAATPYGFMIDHIWAAPEINAARRPGWPEDMFISVLPCNDLDEECEENGNVGAMTRWVFFDSGVEYGAPDADRSADDWLVGRVDG